MAIDMRTYMDIDPLTGDLDAGDPANFPYGRARNVVSSGDGRGTPWLEQIANDIFGFQQKLLRSTLITPSGVTESVDKSQYWDAIRRSALTPGLIAAFGFNPDPAFLPASLAGLRVLPCDGSVVIITDYQELVDATYVGDANNAAAAAAGAPFWKSVDAAGTTPATGGLYYVLPNFQAETLIGFSPSIPPGHVDYGKLLGQRNPGHMANHNHLVVWGEDDATVLARAFPDPTLTRVDLTTVVSPTGPNYMTTWTPGALGGGNISNMVASHKEVGATMANNDPSKVTPTGAMHTTEVRPDHALVYWGIAY